MNVSFNPVSFRASNNYSKQVGENAKSQNSAVEALDKDKSSKVEKSDIEWFNERLHDDAWEKKFEYGGVHVKMPNCFDGTEYLINTSGTVLRMDGWSSPRVILSKHEELGKYVQAMKEYSEKTSNVSFKGLETEKTQHASTTNLLEAFKSQLPNFEANPTGATTKTNTSSENNTELKEDVPDNEKQVADYKNRLNDENWEKFYSKDNNTVYLKEKNKFDGTGYMITADGTVKQVAANSEPVVIAENDSDSKKLFETSDEVNTEKAPEKKKTTMKDKLANVWKFFATFGQMALSTAKGVGYGLTTAVTMLAGSWLFNTLPKAFAKEGPKFTQIVKHPLKHIGTSGKVLAGIGAVAVLAYHLIVGKMAANQKTAVIDHKLYTGHRDV